MIILPRKIYLAAMNQEWKVSYIHAPGKLVLVEQAPRKIVLYGKRYSKRDAMHLITRWLHLKAYDHLNALLLRLGKKVKVSFRKLIIRSQDRQWGSYSTSKTISMNYKLLFLPPVLVRHIVFHELCHIRYLDHSDAFWQEVAKYDKNWQKNRKALNEADEYIPQWVIF